MRQINKRFNFLSHMIDASSDAVVRVGKVSAFWASMGSLAIFVNLILYMGAKEINIITLVIIQFLFWCSTFGVLMVTQMSWISYIVYMADLGLQEDDNDTTPPTPLPTSTTKHYVLGKNSYKIDKVVDTYHSGVGGKE